MIEQWRPVFGYEGRYEVSGCGRVRSLDYVVSRSGKRGNLRVKGGLLSPWAGDNGYLQVNLAGRVERVHVIVARAFHGLAPSPLYEVAHRDGSRDNNASDNLRWARCPTSAAA